tara:strand:+ start:15099 stop:16136 length:1038 start_codon:yes stop_codon:yes gene_type:complete
MSKEYARVLAIETSCDDTSVAIVSAMGEVLSLSSVGQDAEHEIFGGIVPEIASRNHNQTLLPLVEIALDKANMTWDNIDGLCVTSEPGLLGSLIVGVVTAKSLALAKQKDFIGVNHLEGHLVAPFLRDHDYRPRFDMDAPAIALAVSGGHTSLYMVKGFANYQVLGQTIDDAAGEAFDKYAKMLGLGYPGGAKIDRLARGANASAFAFPRTLLGKNSLDFSFSGIKSSAQRMLEGMSESEIDASLHDLCASYQEALVDTLIAKLERALKQSQCKRFYITGGVIANSRLREKVEDFAKANSLEWMAPPPRYCTDNAAMIGLAGVLRLNLGQRSPWNLQPSSRSKVI